MKDNTKALILGAAAIAAVAVTYFHTKNDLAPANVAARARPDSDTPSTAGQATPAARPAPTPSASDTQPGPNRIPRAAAVPAVQPHGTSLTFGDHWNQPDGAIEFNRFAEWVTRYRAARSNEERSALEAEGLALVQARRATMSNLIRENPEEAINRAIPYEIQRDLPDAITAQLEQSISGRGSLSVFAALAEPGKENEVPPVWRTASVGGSDYDAYVYGRHAGEPTRRDLPLSGIVLGRMLAVSDNPVRVLSAAEAAARLPGVPDPVCAVSGQSATVNQTPLAAEVGGRLVRLCGIGHAEDLNGRMIRAEAAGGEGGPAGDDVQGSAYTEGVKRLLVIRVDFPDLAGDPFPTNTGTTLISGLNDFYRESSYGRTAFHLNGSGSSVTATLRMPSAASYYGTNNYYTQLQNDARAAASAAGFNLSNYDFDLTCFGAVPGWGWAGLGWVGASGVWLRSYFTAGVAGHELGHNLGLNHANYWDTSGQSVIGTGTSVEYGDIFDTMGSANAGANHFNTRYKSYLNWLTTSEVQTVTNSGTFRIYAHDDTNSTGIRALKIARNSNTNFWVEFRQKFTGNTWMMNGAALRWAGNGNQRSDLLDTTPGSANGKNDSPLVVGRTFSDRSSGIHITTLRKAGTSPEALDVVVNLGSFPANTPPIASVSASATSLAISAPATFTATASDANGDTLAYYWDFGDGTFGTNGASISKSWSLTGDYVVQCTVTDMKGGTASDSVLVTVGSPSTYRISGQVMIGGSPAVGARVYVSSTRMAYTDSDGTYSIVGLPASSYTVSVNLDGYTFVPSGFSNPVPVGPNATGINFGASGFVSVSLTSPTNNTTFTSPSSVTLAASAAAAAGNTLTRVEFYQGATKLGEDTSSPYSYSWNSPSAGSYTLRAVATDSGGLIATSAPVSIVVSSGSPVITGQPQNVIVAAGSTANFSVTAAGSGLGYSWRCSGTNVTGGTSATLSLASVQTSQAGSYSVVITNAFGSVTSSPATLTVLQAPAITVQPADQSAGVGTSVTLGVTATGTAPLTYQWQRNGSNLTASNASSIQFNPVSLPDAAGYSVVVANSVGSITSRVAVLTVVQAPVISAQPQSRTVAAGSNVTLSVTVAGSNPLSYQWWKDGSPSPATNSAIAFPSAAPSDSGSYFVVVTNLYGSATSTVATLVVNCAYNASAVSASFIWTGGSGSVNLSTHSACSWTVANVPSWITLTSPSSGSGNATITYTVATNGTASSRSATLSLAGISYQVTQAAMDLTPPSVSFVSPADGFTTTTTTPLLVQGTASDNASVSQVQWRVGTNAYATATGTTSWSALMPLALGTNVVTVRSLDASGNASAEVQRSFVSVEPGTITVNVNGHGSVKGATNGQHLKVGKAYSLQAVPAAGYAFSNWTGSMVRYSSTLAFVMETNLAVTANFVPNPFETSKGTFNGLFYETNQVHQDRSGYFTFTMTVKGSYSAALLTRGWNLKAKGSLNLDGRATNQVTTPGGGTYTVTWAIALDGSDQISGVVSDGNWSSPLLGDRLVYHPKTNAAPQAGKYTFLVLGNPGQTTAPGGDSFGAATVSTKGQGQLNGYLADNTRFVARSHLSKSGAWPLYASLYSRQGAILGWVTFRDNPTTDLDGVLSWSRPALTTSLLYPLGFSSEAALIGSRFQPVGGGQPIVDWADPVVRFEGGGLAGPCTNSVSVTSTVVQNLGTNALTMKITPGSGLFSGTMTPVSGSPLSFKGVVIQKANLGSGYFLGTGGTGLATIEENP